MPIFTPSWDVKGEGNPAQREVLRHVQHIVRQKDGVTRLHRGSAHRLGQKILQNLREIPRAAPKQVQHGFAGLRWPAGELRTAPSAVAERDRCPHRTDSLRPNILKETQSKGESDSDDDARAPW
eukprot:3615026-Prymnesium_polylepis.2